MSGFGYRLRREYRTMEKMVHIYCAGNHAGAAGRPCAECQDFLAYAHKRLEKCIYGSRKPTCASCPIHCYKKQQREQARAIMRYAGPRMLIRHPWLTVLHTLDKLRRVEHPKAMRARNRTGTRRQT